MRRPSFIGPLVAVLISLTIAAVSASPVPSSNGQRLRAIETETAKIRGLRQLRPVKVYFSDDKTFNNAVKTDIRRGTPERDIQIGQQELLELGWLRPGQSFHNIVYHGITAQVIGLYSPHDKVFYVRRRDKQVFGPERWVIAHEYTHALQDQHYNLSRLLPNQSKVVYRNTDEIGARHALTEGDAVVTQVLFRDKTYSPRDLAQLRNVISHQPKSASLPKAIQRQFDFPYTTGFDFVRTLYQQQGMTGIDSAYRRLPRSTYEIMHPRAYQRNWKPVDVQLHRVAGFSTWKRTDDDVFGALNYQLLIWQYASRSEADRIVDGYRGDRYVFLVRSPVRCSSKGGPTCKAGQAMLFKSVWRSPGAAIKARNALVRGLRTRYGTTGNKPQHGGLLVHQRDGAVYFKLFGNRLTMAYATDDRTAVRLGTALTS